MGKKNYPIRKYKKKTKLATTVKKLKKVVYNNLQRNWIDTTNSGTSVGAGGVVLPDFCSLQQIAQGPNTDQRQGNKIVVRSISIRAHISVAVGDIFNQYRVIIFSLKDDKPAGQLPLVSDILQNGDLYSHYKKNSALKYKIHCDKFFKLSNILANVGTVAPTELCGAPYPNYIPWFKKITFKGGHEVWYRGAANGQPHRGGIYMLMISDSLGQVPSGHPGMAWQIRMNYDP